MTSTDPVSGPERGSTGIGHRSHDEPGHDMAGHVLAQLGLQFHYEGDHRRTELAIDPVLLDPDGHLNFGVLGIVMDMASSEPVAMQATGPFVHADITAHRLRAPRGRTLITRSTAVRVGRRSGVVAIDLVDDLGTHVARSTQEIVFPGGRNAEPDEAQRQEMRSRFFDRFVGPCSLPGPLYEILEITGGEGPEMWIPLLDASRNGFGGLHGGVATAVVDAAAVAAVESIGHRGRTLTAAVRYLLPSLVGPFRATPTVVGVQGSTAVVVVEVRDTGADDRLTILADVHVDVSNTQENR